MKQLVLLIVLLVFSSGYSQPAKDSLLAKNHQKVDEKLFVAHYLDECAFKYFMKSKQEKAQNNFSRYFREIVVGYNPVPSINISEYLGYKNGEEPKDSEAFCDVVFNKNIETIMQLTKEYGYPSWERMRAGGYTTFHYSSMIFIIRSSDYDKRLKPIFKHENAVGNLSEKEYNHFKFIIKRKKILTNDDIKWLEEKAGVKMNMKNVKQ